MALTLRGVKTRYEVKEVIARGGMGVVYKAYDKVMKRPVALKTLLDISDNKALKLFQKECEDLASLIHPNIVEIFDVGQLEDDEGTKPYLVMPLLPGVTLDKLIRSSSSRLTVERCADIICQTCRGLHAAHERGLIHRDLKPSNIFVMDDDSVKIIDFGVAHRLEASQTLGRKGTLIYMSPEQITMKPLGPASDIFSLGVVCYEALTLRRPFERSTENEVAEAILRYVPPPIHELNPSAPVAVSQAVHKALAKEPAYRFRSARELGEILQKAIHNEPIEIFNPARLKPRLQRAREAYDKGDYEYASEIVGELESEGHLDREINELRDLVERGRLQRRVSQLIETARARMDEQEHQLALQKIDEVLQLDPKNTEALALKSRIDTRRTDQDIEGWFGIARTHLQNRAFTPAREALRRILELRPREPKAAQLLSEVERAEQSHQRLKGEKETLYRAAVEAERAGDLSSALSKLDRILDLDKQAPEPGRTGTYQREYEKVHSEYEALKTARSEAKQLLDDQKFTQASALCEQYLAKYPADTLLQALKWDIEEKKRQWVSARIAETDRRVEAEPDLNRRVSILEQALSENPGEVYFERALQNARDKRDGVNTIVSRARTYEERAQFPEALGQWEMLQAIYPRYPGLRMEIDRLKQRREQSRRQESKSRWVEQIDQQLDAGDFGRAADLVQKALEEFPEDPELAELGHLAQQGLQRHEEAQNLLASGREACAQERFQDAIDQLRHAHDLDGNNSEIRNALVEALVEQGRRLMEPDPRSAEDLLNEALILEPNQALATGLLRMFADQRKIETIDRALAQARRHQASGELKQALDVIEEALTTYPGEQRLLQVQSSLTKSSQDTRRKDLEQAKRIAREVDTLSDLNDERRGQYTDRVDRYMTQYSQDPEFHQVLHPAKRRLETVVEVPSGGSGAVSESRTIPAATVPGGTPGPGQEAGSVARSDRHILPGPRLGNRKQIYVAAGVAAGVLLIAGISLVLMNAHRIKSRPGVLSEGTVAISTTPAGATVLIDGVEAGTTAEALTIRRRAGTYRLEIRLPGYQPVQQSVTIAQGAAAPMAIKLVPELPTLRIFGTGTLYVDNDAPSEIQNGQIQLPLSAAEHTVRVKSGAGEVSFKVRVDADGLPVVSDISSKEMAPLIVSNFGPSTKVYSGSKTPASVQLNGQKVGDLTMDGLDLPALAPNSYDLLIGDGKEAKTRAIEIGPARTVTALLEADPNVGRLLVKTSEDGATVALFVNGKEVSRKTTQNRQASFANLRARSYTVQVSKDGFEADAQKPVDVVKGTEATLSVELRRKVMPGTFQVKTTPGAEVSVDGQRAGVAGADGSLNLPGIAPGTYRVEARLKQYTARATRVSIGDGETKALELPLSRAPGIVRIQRDPAEAVVTYRKLDDTAEKTAPETQLSLPEGTYLFTGRLQGYTPKSVNVVVRADETAIAELKLAAAVTKPTVVVISGIERFWAKDLWTQPVADGWYLHKGEGFIGVTVPVPSTVQFDAPLSPGVFGRKLVWVMDYRDARNYLRCELNDKGLTVTRIRDGKNDGKSPQKPVKENEYYRIRLEWRPDRITVTINGATVDVFHGDFPSGKFGFLGNKEVRMTNFRMETGN